MSLTRIFDCFKKKSQAQNIGQFEKIPIRLIDIIFAFLLCKDWLNSREISSDFNRLILKLLERKPQFYTIGRRRISFATTYNSFCCSRRLEIITRDKYLNSYGRHRLAIWSIDTSKENAAKKALKEYSEGGLWSGGPELEEKWEFQPAIFTVCFLGDNKHKDELLQHKEKLSDQFIPIRAWMQLFSADKKSSKEHAGMMLISGMNLKS